MRPVSAPARPPTPRGRLRRLRRAFWVGVLAAAVGYGVAWTVSAVRLSERAQMAHLASLAAYRAPARPGDSRLARDLDAALAAVDVSRRSTLGLFESVDAEALDAAAASLASVLREGPEGDVSARAQLALGRVRLYQGRDLEAARQFEAVLRSGRAGAPDARRYLDWIRSPSNR